MAAMRRLWVSYDILYALVIYFSFEKLVKNKLCNIHSSLMSHSGI